MTPTHIFQVDLTNPGHFLACCGLLELANCLDPAAVGWFAVDAFHLHLVAEHQDFIPAFRECPARATKAATMEETTQEDGSQDKSPPILLGEPFNFLLNWWTDPAVVRAGFKTWAGGQTVQGFLDGMRARLQDDDAIGPEMLTRAQPLRKPKPFYFDSRLSILTTIDIGFSAEDFASSYSPAVEVLTLVGLQRFRPATVQPRERYAYSIWSEPLSVTVAAAVAHGLVPTLSFKQFQFPFVVRTGGKYKAFGHAIQTRSNHA